ncbi:MAG: hypothetical protein ACQESF_01065, partial [Nanobdellota archaeon]
SANQTNEQENPEKVNAQQQNKQQRNNAQESANQANNQENNPQDTTKEKTESLSEKEVPKDFQFTLPDGIEIKSINDLKESLKKMDEATLAEHIDEQGNDFGQWLGLVTGDQDMAEKFSAIKDRNEMISELEKL